LSSDIYSDYNCGGYTDVDFRANYSFSSFEDLKTSDVCLIIGSDLRSECPNLNLLIKQQVQEDSLTVAYIGPSIELSYPYVHIGLDTSSLVDLMKGKHPFSFHLKKSKNLSVIIGEGSNHENISKVMFKLAKLGCLQIFIVTIIVVVIQM
jgi:NADH dehydrogenase/NADH:ubiquinone oxidoreductase subunit G